MQVFNAYFKIIKNIPQMAIYFVIFITIAIIMLMFATKFIRKFY